MSVLHDARQAIISAVGPVGAQTFDYLPGRLAPPSIVILPGAPYIEPGEVFGSMTVNHTVSIITAQGANDTVTRATDDLVETVLKSLIGAGITVEQVGTFYIFESQGAHYLAADVSINSEVRL